MQPFDALTIRAVLQEAKPLLLNHKVDKNLPTWPRRDSAVFAIQSGDGQPPHVRTDGLRSPVPGQIPLGAAAQ